MKAGPQGAGMNLVVCPGNSTKAIVPGVPRKVIGGDSTVLNRGQTTEVPGTPRSQDSNWG